MKKGFTLIELLAVLVILATILLIIIPIVDNAMDKAEESANLRSAEFYLKAVELAIKRDSLDDIEVPNGTYNIMKNGYLCIGTYNKSSNTCVGHELKVSVNNPPKSGTITIENNLATTYNITLENDQIVKNNEFNNKEEIDTSCFEYIYNYDYTINKEVCNSKFAPTLDSFLDGLGDGVCSGIKSFGSLVNFANVLKITPQQLEDEGIISNVKQLETISIVGYQCGLTEKNVVIPKQINGKNVTSIAPTAFLPYDLDSNPIEEKNVNSVVIKDDIMIESLSFYSNDLDHITFEKGEITVGVYSFVYNKIKDVTIGDSKMTMAPGSFINNEIENLTIQNNLNLLNEIPVETLALAKFSNNKITNLKFDGNATIINNFEYANNKITNLTLENGVKTISEGAFALSNLINVTIGKSVQTIGNAAFLGNELTSVTIPNSVTTIGDSAFMDNNLTSVTIPNSVTTIEASAFRANDLTSITIPNSVTTIGESAFLGNDLTSIMIPNSVTSIGANAFQANNLTSVTIPKSVTTIGESAFVCNNLDTVIIESGIMSIGDKAFYSTKCSYTEKTYGPNALQNVYINKDSSEVTLGNSVFSWASGYNETNNLHWNSTGPSN